MPEKLTEEEIYRRARKRVEDKKSFLVHLIVYLVVNGGLVIIWLLTGHGYPWFVWPVFGWGIGLVFHFLGVYFFDRETGWERSEIEKEAAKLRQSPK